LIVRRRGRLKSSDVTTLPYSGFPTDVQAQMMALMTLAPGISIITERIFESRFHARERAGTTGADIEIEGPSAIVKGGRPLSGAPVMASDLRASAALVVADWPPEARRRSIAFTTLTADTSTLTQAAPVWARASSEFRNHDEDHHHLHHRRGLLLRLPPVSLLGIREGPGGEAATAGRDVGRPGRQPAGPAAATRRKPAGGAAAGTRGPARMAHHLRFIGAGPAQGMARNWIFAWRSRVMTRPRPAGFSSR